MKSKLTTFFVILIFFAGLSFLLYPTISDYYNSLRQTQVIVDYSQQVGKLENESYQQIWAAAEAHNKALIDRETQFSLPVNLAADYNTMLNASSTNVMAYIEIPSVDVILPIEHGTSDEVLQRSVGHVEWSSLPIGGESTHCVLSGHRGLPSSELFTNIDHLVIGDRFYIHVLGKTLVYQVDNITVVLPSDRSLLKIEEGGDYVTLITCTPYGINSHRLLVRGRRIIMDEEETTLLPVKNEIFNIDLMVVIPVALVMLTVAVFIFVLAGNKAKQRRKTCEKQADV